MNSASSGKNDLGQQYDGIEFLSKPSAYAMADEWYEFASAEHFWFRWRFDALKKLIIGIVLYALFSKVYIPENQMPKGWTSHHDHGRFLKWLSADIDMALISLHREALS